MNVYLFTKFLFLHIFKVIFAINIYFSYISEHPPSEEREDFLSEIDILKKIGYHQNIVKLIGCCTLQEPNMMIMEYVPCGDLKQYLLDLRNQWQNLKKSVSDYSVFTSRYYHFKSSPVKATNLSNNK